MPLIRSMAFANILSGSKSASQSTGVGAGVKKNDVVQKGTNGAKDGEVCMSNFLTSFPVLPYCYFTAQ